MSAFDARFDFQDVDGLIDTNFENKVKAGCLVARPSGSCEKKKQKSLQGALSVVAVLDGGRRMDGPPAWDLGVMGLQYFGIHLVGVDSSVETRAAGSVDLDSLGGNSSHPLDSPPRPAPCH